LRVPARALFVTGLSLAVISAKAIGSLSSLLANRRLSNLFGVACILFGVLMAFVVPILIAEFSLQIIWGFVFLILVGIIILLMANFPAYQEYSWIFLILLFIDLTFAGYQYVYFHQQELDGSKMTAISQNQVDDTEIFRLYTPSYSIPQYTAVSSNLEFANGVDPLQLEDYRDFMSRATGVNKQGYFVSIPPFESGKPEIDNADLLPDLDLLSLINVKFLISSFELDDPSLVHLSTDSGQFTYLNNGYFPRAWTELNSKDLKLGNQSLIDIKPVSILARSPNNVVLNAEGPGQLVLSEIYYPGWSVTVDGEPERIIPAYEILRSVNLSEGEHRIIFRYLPISTFGGIILASFSWILIILTVIRKRL
jgi:hypothetical protein